MQYLELCTRLTLIVNAANSAVLRTVNRTVCGTMSIREVKNSVVHYMIYVFSFCIHHQKKEYFTKFESAFEVSLFI